MAIPAVYQILNKITGDSYVGSSCDLKQRWNRHKRELNKGKHHAIYLSRAYSKYGIQSFEFKILEETTKNLLIEREQYYIDLINPIYNSSKVAGSPGGTPWTSERKERMRKYANDNNIKPPKSTYESKMKKIQMLEKTTGNLLKEFESISSAAKHLGKTPDFASSIRDVCNGKRKSILGYRWRWTIV